MEGEVKKFVRFDDPVSPSGYKEEALDAPEPGTQSWRTSGSRLTRIGSGIVKSARRGIRSFGASIRVKFFPEEYVLHGRWWNWDVLDPRSKTVLCWNIFFICVCLAAIFIDPLYFFLPQVKDNMGCIDIKKDLAIIVTVLRTITDIFYLLYVIMQFRIAYINPATRVFGRGELVVDRKLIAERYMRSKFGLDIFAMLPLPQIFLWFVIPALGGSTETHAKNALRYLVLVQYLPRLYRMFPLIHRMQKTNGTITPTAWGGAVFNLFLYLLASHVLGSCYYLLAVERTDSCWRRYCRHFSADSVAGACKMHFLDCGNLHNKDREEWWASNSNMTTTYCTPMAVDPMPDDNWAPFNFGIYAQGISLLIINESKRFVPKYLWTFWWGLLNLSSVGQTLTPSDYPGEVLFCIFIVIIGLVMFALLIGNMQTYLSSVTLRLEQMRLRWRDTEEWMQHRMLPNDLRTRVRRYDQFKWVATAGVDEDALIYEWPADLRRDIKRHMCLDLIRKVPLFDSMDDQLNDAICERLRPQLFTKDTTPWREGDPVGYMLFIVRGRLDSITTNGGRTGFFNMGTLTPGDFCGEELLTWALDPSSREALPASTRSITARSEVEGFALLAEDLKYVVFQFRRRFNSRHLQHVFRFHSHQWRTWAACRIQAAWRHRKRRERRRLQGKPSFASSESSVSAAPALNGDSTLGQLGRVDSGKEEGQTASLGAAVQVSRFMAMAKAGGERHLRRSRSSLGATLAGLSALTSDSPPIPKPAEPDFAAYEAEMEDQFPMSPQVFTAARREGRERVAFTGPL